ncbi:MAG: hypothetical protein QNL12_07515 [Acidimicrobiia bacterium]|nr:hypothetical protein [Acidimicrobiia bacterium]MDX2467144.1 hypothetical protein [Acidimicrobiia bacterium]
MARFGSYFIIVGALSGVLSLFDYEFSLLIWIDTWGDGFAWLIRGAFILGGMAMVSHEMKTQQQPQQAPQSEPTATYQDPVR